MKDATYRIVVMGVSGSGKSLIGERLALYLGTPFHDADDYHSEENIAKMANGIPLDDKDRSGWLDELVALVRREESLVLGCSALKRQYRDRLREAAPDLVFLFLEGDFDTICARLQTRRGHYFSGEAMLRSQFEQLEAPDADEAHIVDIRQEPEQVLEQCMAALSR